MEILSETLAKELRVASVSEVAARAGVPRRSVQGILDGHVPSVDRAARICTALGLELRIIGRRRASGDVANEPSPRNLDPHTGSDGSAPGDVASEPSPRNLIPGTQLQRPLTTFSWREELPIREWGSCSSEGYLSEPETIGKAPMPVDLFDEQAFYGRMTGQGVPQEGIGGRGFYCLISPNTPLGVGVRVWLRNRSGREVIRRLEADDSDAYVLRAWGRADEHGRQQPINDRWKRADVEAAGVVLAVYAGPPSVEDPPFCVPDAVGSELDHRLEILVSDLVKHYRRLNEYGRNLFVKKMREHFPVSGEAENPAPPIAGEE